MGTIAYVQGYQQIETDGKPIAKEGNRAIYNVKNDPSIQVCLYDSSSRNQQSEFEVMSALNGGGFIGIAHPVDVVYIKGKFAGFTLMPTYSAPVQPEPVKSSFELNAIMCVGIVALAATALSLLGHFVLFPDLDLICRYPVIEIVMLLVGWGVALFVSIWKRDSHLLSVLGGIGAFLVALIAVFFLSLAIVQLVLFTISILPTLITGGVLILGGIAALRSFFRRGR